MSDSLRPVVCSTLGFSVLLYLQEFAQTHVHWVDDAIWPSYLLLFHSQSFPTSGSFPMSWLFTSGDQSIGAFSFRISPSSEYSGLIFFGTDWLDLPAAQGTLKSLLQHHSLKASILWCSALFMVQLSQPYMTTGKVIALTRWTFVGKMMSLLFQ